MSTHPAEPLPVQSALVYVVDADPRVRTSVRALLTPLGGEVRAFATAADALDAIADAPPGCMIADAHLPDLDGLALLDTLQRRGILVPTILLSQDDDVSFAVAAMRAGAVDFLQKPFVERALLNQVAPLLGLDERAG